MGGASNARRRRPPPPLGRRPSAAARWPSLANVGVCGGKSLAACFIVDTFAHFEEEAVGVVSAPVIEVSGPAAAPATEADLFAFALSTSGGVRVGVVSSKLTEIYDGAWGGNFGLNSGGESAFSCAKISVTPFGPEADLSVAFGV
eukprot:scaffold2963_cov112-Isochrysis_galbana.AAC.3